MPSINSQLYIGVLSGTSMDAVDAALVDFSNNSCKLIDSLNYSIPKYLKKKLTALVSQDANKNSLQTFCELDQKYGHLFADAVNALLLKNKINSNEIIAIGSHGQTIYHNPKKLFTLQIGDPNIICAKTNIPTIADFRRKDTANNGQGAPLTPAFHKYFFGNNKNRVIVNIGGIANITILSKTIRGFDTGPGNALLDAWIKKNKNLELDSNGAWAKSGNVNFAFLSLLLKDPYFKLKPPKSTGKELFNLPYLENKIKIFKNKMRAEDVQATLTELTAQSIVNAIDINIDKECEIIICGGGAYNKYLLARITALAKKHKVFIANDFGIDANWIEAVAFAWFAKQAMNKKQTDLEGATMAGKPSTLGGIYYP